MIGGLDLVVFLGSLALVMTIGILAARREHTTEDFFLAGRSVRWWGVAGSIFGTNVSASQLVGHVGNRVLDRLRPKPLRAWRHRGAHAPRLWLSSGLPAARRLHLVGLAWTPLRRPQSNPLRRDLGRRDDRPTDPGRSTSGPAPSACCSTARCSRSPTSAVSSRCLSSPRPTPSSVGSRRSFYTDVLQSVLLLAAGVLVAVLTFAPTRSWRLVGHDGLRHGRARWSNRRCTCICRRVTPTCPGAGPSRGSSSSTRSTGARISGSCSACSRPRATAKLVSALSWRAS